MHMVSSEAFSDEEKEVWTEDINSSFTSLGHKRSIIQYVILVVKSHRNMLLRDLFTERYIERKNCN